MAKPTVYAQWDTNSTNLSAPTSGHKTDGWAVGEVPTSTEMNGWMRIVSDYTAWLLDGSPDTVVTVKTLSDGANDDVDLTGTATLSGFTYFNVTHTAVSNQALLGGIANGYDGKEIVILAQGSTNDWILTLEDSGSTASNRIAKPPGFPTDVQIYVPSGAAVRLRYTAGSVNRWLVIGTAFCYTWETTYIPATTAVDVAGNATKVRQGYIFPADTVCAIYIPLTLPASSVLSGYQVLIQKTSNASQTVDTNFASYDWATDATTDGTPATQTGTGTLTVDYNVVETTALGAFNQIRVRSLNAAGGGTGDVINGVALTILRPIT
jgi:hypothetical protein